MTKNDASPAPFSHWMLREIHEQPHAMAATLERYTEGDGLRTVVCGAITDWLSASSDHLIFAASGSSRHASMFAELMIEDLSPFTVDVEYASEYCYRTERGLQNASVVVVSQSGETVDTVAALRKAIAAGHPTLAISNVEASTLSTSAGVSFPTLAGKERAIPATKSFTTQLLNLYLLALMCGVARGTITPDELKQRVAELRKLPDALAAQLEGWEAAMRSIASAFSGAESFLFVGRGLHYPIAREGALKLKESAYLHAEGYPSGELKHGPNALVSEGTPLVMIATVDRSSADSVQRYEKVVQLMSDMREQGATILAVANTGDETVSRLATQTVFVDEMREPLLAICEIIPLQFFSCFMALNKGIDVDHPRNLTKAVLAE